MASFVNEDLQGRVILSTTFSFHDVFLAAESNRTDARNIAEANDKGWEYDCFPEHWIDAMMPQTLHETSTFV